MEFPTLNSRKEEPIIIFRDVGGIFIIFFFQVLIEHPVSNQVKILIRCHIMQCLIWLCTVCLCSIKRALSLYRVILKPMSEVENFANHDL